MSEAVRVSSVYAARVEVWADDGPRLVALRRTALRDAPIEGGIAVGDWVKLSEAGDVVAEVLPRRTVFLRQAAGERSEPQAICANIDRVFVVTALEGDYTPRRVERYLVAIRAGGAEAIIVLAKADLVDDADVRLAGARAMARAILTSAKTGQGIDELRAAMPEGTVSALAGSSGVGKSAIVNRLLGRDAQPVGLVREHDKRGRHTTTRRALFEVPGGGLLIDTPGMRELKPWGADDTAESFADVDALIGTCRYSDCRHEKEPGCAVRDAISPERLASFKKLEVERAAHAERQAGHAEAEAKRLARVYRRKTR